MRQVTPDDSTVDDTFDDSTIDESELESAAPNESATLTRAAKPPADPLRQSMGATLQRRVVSARPRKNSLQGITPPVESIEGYVLKKLLGRGGMGHVWLGERGEESVAIKILNSSALDDEALARFKREAEIGMELRHPNLTRVFGYGSAPHGPPYMIMEHLNGVSLSQVLKSAPLPLPRVTNIMGQLCGGLHLAHQAGLVHRDLKPHNIFLTYEQNIKILDFGISKKRNSMTIITDSDIIMGTPNYMSPEQATGSHDMVNASTDVFALGLLLYEMLSGKRAFPGKVLHDIVFNVVYRSPAELSTIVPSLPDHVYNTVSKAIAKNQSERFQRVDDMFQVLTGEVKLSDADADAARLSEHQNAETVRNPKLFVRQVSDEKQPTGAQRKSRLSPLVLLTLLGIVAGLAAFWLFR